MPIRSAVPGRKFCTKTSAPAVRRRSSSRPRGWRRSSTSERLLRFTVAKVGAIPRGPAPIRRTRSPEPGASTLITSAPWSPSIMVASGPEIMLVQSITRTPASGPDTAGLRADHSTRLRNGLRLAIEEVVHHHDVDLPAIVRPGRNVARDDLHASDRRFLEHDAEEGETAVAGGRRHEAAEQQLALGVEVVDPRAGPTLSVLLAAVRAVHVGEDRAEACHRGGVGTGAARHEEESLGDVASDRREETQRAEGAEGGAIVRVPEQLREAALRPALGRRLREPHARGEELCPAAVEERVERGHGIRRGVDAPTSVPVDLASTARERPRVVAVP